MERFSGGWEERGEGRNYSAGEAVDSVGEVRGGFVVVVTTPTRRCWYCC